MGMTNMAWTLILVIIFAMILAGLANWIVRGNTTPPAVPPDANNTVNAINEVRNPSDTNDIFEPEK